MTTAWKIPPFWNDERVAALARLWAEGKSAREISLLIPGSTKNGVIGRAHRDGLQARPSPIPVKPKRLLVPSARSCEWPMAEPYEPCGAEPEPGKPYCLKHCKRAYRHAIAWTDERREKQRMVALRINQRKRLERHP